MSHNNDGLSISWRDAGATDSIVELRDGQLVVTIDGTGRSLSVPDLEASFHRSGEGLTIVDGIALPTPAFKNRFNPSRSVLLLTDGQKEVRIGVEGKELLEFEHHQRIEPTFDLNLSVEQIRDLRDALIIEGVAAPTAPQQDGSPKTRTFDLEKYDASGFGGPQLKSSLFSVLVLFAIFYAWFLILDRGLFDMWMQLPDEGKSWLAGVILVVSLLATGIATKLFFWIHDRLDGRHVPGEYQLILIKGREARFCHSEDGEIASAKIRDLTILPREVRISFFSSRTARSMMSSNTIHLDRYTKRRLPALEIQFPNGPTIQVTSQYGYVSWKNAAPPISESKVDFQVSHSRYYLMIILFRLQDQVTERFQTVPQWLGSPDDRF